MRDRTHNAWLVLPRSRRAWSRARGSAPAAVLAAWRGAILAAAAVGFFTTTMLVPRSGWIHAVAAVDRESGELRWIREGLTAAPDRRAPRELAGHADRRRRRRANRRVLRPPGPDGRQSHRRAALDEPTTCRSSRSTVSARRPCWRPTRSSSPVSHRPVRISRPSMRRPAARGGARRAQTCTRSSATAARRC